MVSFNERLKCVRRSLAEVSIEVGLSLGFRWIKPFFFFLIVYLFIPAGSVPYYEFEILCYSHHIEVDYMLQV